MKGHTLIIKLVIAIFVLGCADNSTAQNKSYIAFSLSATGSVNLEGREINLYSHSDAIKQLFPTSIDSRGGTAFPYDKRDFFNIDVRDAFGTNADLYMHLVDDEVAEVAIEWKEERFPNIVLNLFNTKLKIEESDTIADIKQKISQMLSIVQQNKFYYDEFSNSDHGVTFFIGSDENINDLKGFDAQVSFFQFENQSLKSLSIFFSHTIDRKYDQPLYRLMQKQGVANPADVNFDEE